jgi:hypothetical protein
MVSVKASKSIGTPTKENLAGWADYAKGNSYQCDKAELRHKLGTEGAAEDLKINEAEAAPLKPYHEGRGWTKDSVTDNTYTGKGGSKRD